MVIKFVLFEYEFSKIWIFKELANKSCGLSHFSQLPGRPYHTYISIQFNIIRERFSMAVLPYRNTRKTSTCRTIAKMLHSHHTLDKFY